MSNFKMIAEPKFPVMTHTSTSFMGSVGEIFCLELWHAKEGEFALVLVQLSNNETELHQDDETIGTYTTLEEALKAAEEYATEQELN